MKKIFNNRKIIFIVLAILIFLIIFINKIEILEQIGEKVFLEFHNQNISAYILELTTKIDTRPPEEKFYVYYLLGRIYFVDNKLSDSVDRYTQAVKLNPNFKESYYGRGLTYGFLNPIFYKDAESDFQKYIELDNTEFEKTGRHAYGAWAGYNDLAWIYFLKGDFVNAELTARAGLEISQTNPWLSNMLGVTLLAQKKCPEAKKYFKNAENLLQKINTERFGEAYSGDNPDFWVIGKEQMADVIQDNLKTCSKQK